MKRVENRALDGSMFDLQWDLDELSNERFRGPIVRALGDQQDPERRVTRWLGFFPQAAGRLPRSRFRPA